jgi:glycosyltransferase involved in cell wall biosynthesis
MRCSKKLAVLMSVYANDDAENFERALQSVLHQVVPEGFVVRVYLGIDGPIGAALKEKINLYREEIFRLVVSEVNQGLGVMLNELIDSLGDEEFIFRMDADDVSLPHRFLRQVEFFENNPNIDIVGGSIIEFSDCGAFEVRTIYYPTDPETIRKNIAIRSPVAHPTVCFRSRVFDVISGYPISKSNEDIALWFVCISHGFKMSNLEEPVLKFRIDQKFYERRSFRKAIEELREYERGIFALHGISFRALFPVLRFFFRLMPSNFTRLVYSARARFLATR